MLRGSDGGWRYGFTYNIGMCDVELVELWGVLKGLEFAWQRGPSSLILETDSELVVKWLDRHEVSCASALNLVRAC